MIDKTEEGHKPVLRGYRIRFYAAGRSRSGHLSLQRRMTNLSLWQAGPRVASPWSFSRDRRKIGQLAKPHASPI